MNEPAAPDVATTRKRPTVLSGVVRTMRPHQWVKNGFVLVPVVYAHQLTDLGRATSALIATLLFCLASSAVYFLNDLVDAESDRAHPLKRHRPIASGVISRPVAISVIVVLVTVVVVGGLLLDIRFAAVALAYLVLNVAYSLRLKAMAYVDVLCIAAGFEFRVLAGSFAAAVEPSAYLLIVTAILALFLGFGKRYQEALQGEAAQLQRRALSSYHPQTLRLLLHGTALATVVTYVVYTLDPQTIASLGTAHLIWTAPMPAFGVLRFLQLAKNPRLDKRKGGESPTEAMLRDWPFLLNLFVWAIVTFGVIYVSQS